MKCDLVLRNVRLPSGRTCDLSLGGGTVRHAGAPLPADRGIDCTGLTVLPGAVDMHVHMRGGVQREKEDWMSGTQSALAGGVTVVVDQPNTVPPVLAPERFRERVREAMAGSVCGFAINGGVKGPSGIVPLFSAGAMAFGEIFAAPSSYGEAVPEGDLAASFTEIARGGGLATIHAEEVLPGIPASLPDHDRLRPGEGEVRAVERVRLLNRAGCRLHFCHMSTAGGLAACRGGGTAEVTPHHLLLSHDRFAGEDGRGKVNPPLRSGKEQKALRAELARADVIASDHAPHTRVEKVGPFGDAPSGIPGVETMVPLLLAGVAKGWMTLPALVEKTVTAPCRILGIPPAGFSPGDRADFALYPPGLARVDADRLHSRAGWTPFEGFPAIFPKVVVREGLVAFEGGQFFPVPPHWFPGRGYIPGERDS